MRKIRLLIVAGARPNFMKIAPLIKAIEAYNSNRVESAPEFEWRLVHTGQHYDVNMSDVFFRELAIPAPHVNLEVGSGSHAAQTANVMLKFEPVLLAENPDWIIVVGDVNSTVACALVASKLGVKIAHVEAGLRSFDRTMPEEINRLATDALADLLLTPSSDANENLRSEGIADDKIMLVGNIMIDALVDSLPAARRSQIMDLHNLSSGGYVYVTLHRPANVDRIEALTPIIAELDDLAQCLPVIFPMHPRTRKMLGKHSIEITNGEKLKIIEPVGYYDSLRLTENARFVITDSGGLQEETTYFQTPCLTLRPNTERPITITVGSNRLTTIRTLNRNIVNILKEPIRFGKLPDHWDGKTSERIVKSLIKHT